LAIVDMFSLSVQCYWDICFFCCQTPVNIFSLYCMNCDVQKHKGISKVKKDIVLRCVLMFTLHSRMTFYLKLSLSCKLVSKLSEYCDVWYFPSSHPLRQGHQWRRAAALWLRRGHQHRSPFPRSSSRS
jgi:hypothetical protein